MNRKNEYLSIQDIWYEVLPKGEVNSELEDILPAINKGVLNIAIPFEEFPVSLLKKAEMGYLNIPAEWEIKSMNHIIISESDIIGYAHVDAGGELVTPWAHISIYRKDGRYLYNLLVKDLSSNYTGISCQEVNYKSIAYEDCSSTL